MDKFLVPFKQGRLLNTLFLINVFISLHYYVILFINSSFLSLFYSDGWISFFYILGSIGDVILLLNASKIIQKIGDYRFLVYTLLIETLGTIGMAVSNNPTLIAFYFLLHVLAISLILFNLDIFLEAVSDGSEHLGSIRATYLTIMNLMVVIAPLFVAYLVLDHYYVHVYQLSFLFLLPVFYLIHRLKRIQTKPRRHIEIRKTIAEYKQHKNLSSIWQADFFLQLFYAFMTVYMPIYLEKYIGFSWSQIGLMFTIMLLPFIFFELPIAEAEDETYGEKEFLIVGFVLMGIPTLLMSFLLVKSFWLWTAVLFISRVGASFVEVSSESYFFKHVTRDKTDIISFFRVTRPLAFIIAPLLATITLFIIPFQYMFIFVGAIMIFGTHFGATLKEKHHKVLEYKEEASVV